MAERTIDKNIDKNCYNFLNRIYQTFTSDDLTIGEVNKLRQILGFDYEKLVVNHNKPWQNPYREIVLDENFDDYLSSFVNWFKPFQKPLEEREKELDLGNLEDEQEKGNLEVVRQKISVR